MKLNKDTTKQIMKLPLKQLITARVICQKVCVNLMEEAKTEIPSCLLSSNHHYHFQHYEPVILVAVFLVTLKILAKQFEIKDENKLKPFVDGEKIHNTIRYSLFLVLLFAKVSYYQLDSNSWSFLLSVLNV